MIPSKLLKEILKDEYYTTCVRNGEGTCQGRITFEHALIFAGTQVQEKFAIIPLCAFHHAVDEYQDGGDLQKEINHFYALNRASEADMDKYAKSDWRQRRKYLNKKYEDRR